ncbi:MAG TPA: type II toxin-antitoxin system HigB family toxin [Candidatus Binataceae bacterium]|nr:type II toxin-antitoxin system HigB family toxin [Candidatus Binataceae bacterium]
MRTIKGEEPNGPPAQNLYARLTRSAAVDLSDGNGRREMVRWACSRIGNDARVLSVRVIARRTLTRFVESLKEQKGQRAVKAALDAWFHEVERARWRNSVEVKQSYATASIVSADRVVFNVKGNDYRLVAAIDYVRQIVFIKWIGTHADCDRIDARRVQYGD